MVRTRWFTDNPYIRERREAVLRPRYIGALAALYVLASVVHGYLLFKRDVLGWVDIPGRLGLVAQAVYIQQGLALAVIMGILLPLLTAINTFREHSRNRMTYVQLTPIPRSAIVFGMLAREFLTVGLLLPLHVVLGIIAKLTSGLTLGQVCAITVTLTLSATFGVTLGAAVARFFDRSLTSVILTVLLITGGTLWGVEWLQREAPGRIFSPSDRYTPYDEIRARFGILSDQDRKLLLEYLETGLDGLPVEGARGEEIRMRIAWNYKAMAKTEDAPRVREYVRILTAFPWWHLTAAGISPRMPYDLMAASITRFAAEELWWDSLEEKLSTLKKPHAFQTDKWQIELRYYSDRKVGLEHLAMTRARLEELFSERRRRRIAAETNERAGTALVLLAILQAPPQGVPTLPQDQVERALSTNLSDTVANALALFSRSGAKTWRPYNDVIDNMNEGLSRFPPSPELVYLVNGFRLAQWPEKIREELVKAVGDEGSMGKKLTRDSYLRTIRALASKPSPLIVANNPVMSAASWEDEPPLPMSLYWIVAFSWVFKLGFSVLLFRWIAHNLFASRPMYLPNSILVPTVILACSECIALSPYPALGGTLAVPIIAIMLASHNKSQSGFSWQTPRWPGVLYNLVVATTLVFAGRWLLADQQHEPFPDWVGDQKLLWQLLLCLIVFEAVRQLSAVALGKSASGIIAVFAGVVFVFVVDSTVAFAPLWLFAFAGLQLIAILALGAKIVLSRFRPPILGKSQAA